MSVGRALASNWSSLYEEMCPELSGYHSESNYSTLHLFGHPHFPRKMLNFCMHTFIVQTVYIGRVTESDIRINKIHYVSYVLYQ